MKAQNYEARLRRSRVLCAVGIALAVVGIALLLWRPLPAARTNDMLIAMLCGISGGLAGSIWHTSRTLRDPDRIRRAQISDQDERVQALMARAAWQTLAILFCAGFAAMVYFVFQNPPVAVAIAWVMGGTLVLWLLLLWRLSRRN